VCASACLSECVLIDAFSGTSPSKSEMCRSPIGELTLSDEERYKVHIPREVAVKRVELETAAVQCPCIAGWDATVQIDAEQA
jgi:hypothetical protein